jgi:hypothetical protein
MLNATTLQKVSSEANRHYWDLHAILMGAKIMADKLNDDDDWTVELRSLLGMASMKACEMQDCFNAHIPRNEADHG